MRRTLLQTTSFLGLCAFLIGGAQAQDKASAPDPGQHAPRMAGAQPLLKALKALTLTDDQKTKLQPITDKFQADLQAVKDKKLDKAEERTQVRDLSRKFRTDVAAILTPEQQDQLKAELSKGRAGSKNGSKPAEEKPADKTDPNAAKENK